MIGNKLWKRYVKTAEVHHRHHSPRSSGVIACDHHRRTARGASRAPACRSWLEPHADGSGPWGRRSHRGTLAAHRAGACRPQRESRGHAQTVGWTTPQPADRGGGKGLSGTMGSTSLHGGPAHRRTAAGGFGATLGQAGESFGRLPAAGASRMAQDQPRHSASQERPSPAGGVEKNSRRWWPKPPPPSLPRVAGVD